MVGEAEILKAATTVAGGKKANVGKAALGVAGAIGRTGAGMVGSAGRAMEGAATALTGLRKPATPYLLAAILLFLSDMYFGYGGGDFSPIYNLIFNFSLTSLKAMYFNIVTVTIFTVASIFYLRKKAVNEMISFYLVLFTFFTIIFTTANSYGKILHLTFALWIYFTYVRTNSEDKVGANYFFALFMFVDIFLFSIIGYYVTGEAYETLSFLSMSPIWFFYVYFTSPSEMHPWWANGFIIAFIIALVATGLTASFLFVGTADVEITKDQAKNYFQKYGEVYSNLINAFKKRLNETTAAAAGTNFQGQVDSATVDKLGVYLEDKSDYQRKYYLDDNIIVSTILVAQTLDDPINILLDCYIKHDDDKIYGTIYASGFDTRNANQIEVTSYASESVECRFEKGQVPQSINQVYFDALFDFSTKAYVEQFFTRDGVSENYQVQGRDIFSENGISNKKPSATYTNGPLNIGMGFDRGSLIELDSGGINQFKFVVTFRENGWSGKIQELNEFIIYVPDDLTLVENSCNYEFEKDDENTVDGFNAYSLKANNYIFSNFKDVPLPFPFSCWFEVPRNKIDKLLGGGDSVFSTESFLTYVSYNFNLEKNVPIVISKPPWFYVSFEPEFPGRDEEIECIGYSGNLIKKLSGATYEITTDDIVISKNMQASCSEKKCVAIVPTQNLKGKDKLTCTMKAIFQDGTTQESVATTYIKNTAPVLDKLYFEPDKLHIDEEIKCVAEVSDADDDIVEVIFNLGEKELRNEKIDCFKTTKGCKAEIMINTYGLEPGDGVSCIANPTDGKTQGVTKSVTGELRKSKGES